MLPLELINISVDAPPFQPSNIIDQRIRITVAQVRAVGLFCVWTSKKEMRSNHLIVHAIHNLYGDIQDGLADNDWAVQGYLCTGLFDCDKSILADDSP